MSNVLSMSNFNICILSYQLVPFLQECTTSNLGVAGCLGQLQNRHDLIYNSIKGADWTILPGEINPSVRFQFTPDGYGNIGYNIYNYRRTDFQDDNSYGYVKVGATSHQ